MFEVLNSFFNDSCALPVYVVFSIRVFEWYAIRVSGVLFFVFVLIYIWEIHPVTMYLDIYPFWTLTVFFNLQTIRWRVMLWSFCVWKETLESVSCVKFLEEGLRPSAAAPGCVAMTTMMVEVLGSWRMVSQTAPLGDFERGFRWWKPPVIAQRCVQ